MASWRLLLVLSVVSVCLSLVVLLGQTVYQDMKAVRNVERDTVQWTLSQVEVDYLNLLRTIEQAEADATESSTTFSTDRVRLSFDLLYSRLAILHESPVYSVLKDERIAGEEIRSLQGFLTRNTTLIDTDDATLRAALPRMRSSLMALRADVRAIYMKGLQHFSAADRAHRQSLFDTLGKLSGFLVLLLTALGGSLIYALRANARTRQREQVLACTNEHMHTILSTSLDAVIVAEANGKVLDFNGAAERIFGYALHEAVGQNVADLIVPDHLRAAHLAGVKRLLDTGKTRVVGKGPVRMTACRADGSEIPVEMSLQSATGANGPVIISFLREISHQIEIEEELRTARDQALAGEKAKADFIAVMSHELRTPLNGLLGNLTLLNQTRRSREQQRYTENMEISGRQLMKHVNAVLDLSRLESGKVELRNSSFHIGHLLQETLDSQCGRAAQKNTALEWGWIGPAMTWVHSDRNHIEQVLLNLVGNAIKFTDDGRVSIEAERLPSESAASDGQPRQHEMVEFRIIDTGIGIDETDQARIFNDFETTLSALEMSDGSTGLGLGIARRMVEVMGGEIGVESSPGEGSVFWFRLPLKPVDAPVDCAPANCDQPPLPALSILVAEDNDINAFVVRKMLEADGHQVVLVSDGRAAVDAVQGGDFDGVLMDINMPRMDGIGATKAIRALGGRMAELPIFAFSANVLPKQTELFAASGMNGCLSKPLQIEELRAVLGNMSTTPAAPCNTARQQPAMKGALDDEEYALLRESFIREGNMLIEWLSGIENADFDHIAAACHKTRTSATLFGMAHYGAALQQLEQAARAKDAGGCSTGSQQVANAWHSSLENL